MNRIIHQSWKTENIPECWQESVDAWRKFAQDNEGWEYKLWTDEMNRELIKTRYPWFIERYDSYEHGIMRADCARYFALCTYGGVYSDLDICPKDTFIHVFEMFKHLDVAFTQTKRGNAINDDTVSNCLFMSKIGAPFWFDVFRYLMSPTPPIQERLMSAIKHHSMVLNTTGPGVINEVRRRTNPKSFGIIPCALTQPGHEWSELPYQDDNSQVKLLRGQSWQKSDGSRFRDDVKFLHNREKLILPAMVFFLLTTVVFLCLFITHI